MPRSLIKSDFERPAHCGSEAPAAISRDEARCERCGGLSARTFGEHAYCSDCYYIAGSCCREFGGDDLWASALAEERNKTPDAPPR